MDPLSTLLRDTRADCAVFDRSFLRGPWSVPVKGEEERFGLVILLGGDGTLTPEGGDPLHLGARDVAVIAPGTDFVVSGRGVDLEAEGAGRVTLLTVTYHLHRHRLERLAEILPPTLVVPDEAGSCPLLEVIVDEFVHERPARDILLTRSLDLLLLAVVREWFERDEVNAPSWLRASNDPVVGRALRALHEEPGRRWTVADLAARGGVSRASFARRFNELVGESPIAYLTAWRMTLASELLLEPGATVDSVSRRVGYADPYGFSEAFRRHLGLRPGAHRDLLTAGGKGRGAGRVGDRPLGEDFEDQTS
ncbi:AraC family transcriptional regulator [Nocardiopsis alba]|uniref:helix-turn-helix transcriptional regulator n=1 Tax=Nocardiopsis alba TaxID=53437 RepID=UPI0033D3FD8C